MKDNYPERRENSRRSESEERLECFRPHGEFEVTCIRMEATSSGRHHIARLGVRLGDENILIDVPDVAALIKMGKRFYVSRSGKKTFLRAMVSANGNPYVETKEDATLLDNLTSLPACSEVIVHTPVHEAEVSTPAYEAEASVPVYEAVVPIPAHEAEAKTEEPERRLSRAGWIWLLAALLLVLVFGLAILFAVVPVLALSSTTLIIVATLALILVVASVLIFREPSKEVYEHHFRRRQRGWLALIALLLMFILLLILLNPGTPAIAFAPLPDKTYLDSDFSVSASQSNQGPVSFKTALNYFCSVTKEGLVHINNAGGCAVTAYNPANPRVVPVTRTFTINRKSQAITLAQVPDKVYGDPDFSLTANTDSTLPVSFTASGACSALDNATHILSAGSCTIIAHQTGNENYLPAQDVKITVAVGKQSQTLSFTGPGDQSLGKPIVPLSASVSSGLPVSFSAVDPTLCKTSGTLVNLLNTGPCSITASQPGNENYLAASEVKLTFNIASIPAAPKQDQAITFGPLSPTVFGSPDFAINASASSGLGVSFTASGKCSVAGASVKIIGAGACTITAHQEGDDRYNPAAAVSQNLTIAKATTVIYWGNPCEILVGTPLGPTELYANARAAVWNATRPYTVVPGKYKYAPGDGAILPVGVNRLHVVFTPTDTDNYIGSEATVNVLVLSVMIKK